LRRCGPTLLLRRHMQRGRGRHVRGRRHGRRRFLRALRS
jgi:hypothetical protein